HVREMELLLDVAKALTGTLDLPEQLEQLGRLVCDALGVDEFSAMLVDEATHQLVIEAVAGQAPQSVRGMRFRLGEGVTGATGVPNRRHLFARLEQELSRSLRFGDELTVLMIDLDLFKQVNDAFGHTVGDAVLRGVALALRRNVRKVDLVARYGGEEFVVVLPRIAREEAIEVAEKLRRAVAATPLPAPPGAGPVHVTISVGVASFGHDATDVAGLI